jgi:FHA domain
MAVCPNGHDSASDDFCDVCGIRILSPADASSTSAVAQPSSPAVAQPPFSPAPPSPPVPPVTPVPTEISVPVTPSPSPAPSTPSTPTAPPASAYVPVAWTAVVSSDRDYYDSVQAASGPEEAIPFPGYCAERRFRLSGSQMRIGRRSVSRGLDPEIDLTGPPADPGISRLHAVLIAGPDGSWSVLDPGSANGTLVNGTEIPAGDPVPLHDGDRINLGAWTAIMVRCG